MSFLNDVSARQTCLSRPKISVAALSVLGAAIKVDSIFMTMAVRMNLFIALWRRRESLLSCVGTQCRPRCDSTSRSPCATSFGEHSHVTTHRLRAQFPFGRTHHLPCQS